jgi:hypothetical protein
VYLLKETIVQLTTSLAEIWSFKPCQSGWFDVVIGQNKDILSDDVSQIFNVSETLESNSLCDVLWLLRKKKQYNILAKFARKCADSVAHIKNSKSSYAQNRAYAYAYAAAAEAAEADAAAEAAYAYAAAAYAEAAAAYAAAEAAEADAARKKQNELNKSFLIELLNSVEEI